MHNWDDLRFFLAVARARSVSGASTTLAVNQSTVSRRINSFEQDIGVRLFDRLKRGYELTEAGTDLFLRAERIEQEALLIDADLADSDVALTGPIRVTTIQAMMPYLLTPIFEKFLRRHPGIELWIDASNNLYNLTQREADVAIRFSLSTPPENLIGRQLGQARVAVYGRRDMVESWLAKPGAEPLRWIGEMNHDTHPSWLAETFSDLDLKMRCNDVLLTVDAIRQGIGIGRLPRFMGENEADLAEFPAGVEIGPVAVWLLMHPELRRVNRVLQFSRFLADELRPVLAHY